MTAPLTTASEAGLECPDESIAQSASSPGPVLDGERLGRFVRDDDVMEDGHLAPAAFPIRDMMDAQRRGVSVARLDHMTSEDIQQRLVAPARRFTGCAVTVTRLLRALRSPDGRRSICVVDDAQVGFDAHALVRLAYREGNDKASVRRLRERLLAQFECRVTMA